MLFIRRKTGESIIINDSIHVQIEDIQGKSVKLSFICPEGTSVLRQEVFDRIRYENQKAQESLSLIQKALQHG